MRFLAPVLLISTAASLSPLFAQTQPALSFDSGAGLHHVDGAFLALGPDYKAFFTPAGVEFVPALGERAPRNLPLYLSFASASRGGVELVGAQPRLPLRAGEFAQFQRDGGVIERYDATDAGLEQSFVFEQRPAGDGDLVVRMRVSGELALSESTDSRLAFSQPGIGGVSIGAVTGIDARGARVAGRLESGADAAGQYVELSLPDAFVDSAAFPLVLDPLIGTSINLSTGFTQDQRYPDVIWSESSDAWVAAWTVIYSSSDYDVTMRSYDASGTPIAGAIPVEVATTTLALNPKVAAVDPSDSVIVAWTQAAGIGGSALLRSVRPNGNSLSSIVVLQSSGGTSITSVDVAGRRSGGASALAVWSIDTLGGSAVRSRSISVPQGGTPSLGTTFIVETGTQGNAKLARFPDNSGRHFVGYEIASNLQCELLDSVGVPTGHLVLLPSGVDSGIMNFDLDMAADGSRHVVSRMTSNILAWTTTRYDWLGKLSSTFLAFEHISTFIATNPISLTGTIEDSGVAISGGSAFICSDWGLGEQMRRYSIIDGALISMATIPTPVGTVLPVNGLTMAARSNAYSLANDGLFIAYETAQKIHGQLGEVFGPGSSQSLGGACGGGGSVTTNGPAVIGNFAFAVGNSGVAAGSALAILNMSAPGTPLVCGTCAWNPFLVTFARIPSGTSVPPVTLAVPFTAAVNGIEVEFQWTVVGTPQTPCELFSNASVSDRLRVTIGE
ncbi:MAG: hypothetical protein EPO68_04970 [Planctomycetota bacterium]|nr:MAG: hypothetical protein EPO68_04970 [Planctomycetota bacterium]